jgi:hypothetical protein
MAAPGTIVTLEQARAAKEPARAAVSRLATVVGVGVTRVGNGYGVKVNLESVPAGAVLPTSVDGVPVRVEVVGTIRKQ